MQGSIHSLLLLTIYIKLLDEVIHHFKVMIANYTFQPCADQVMLFKVLSQCLEAMQTWMGKYRLGLNPNKTNLLFF